MKAACLGNLFGLLGLVTVTAWCGTAEAATLILGASAQSRYDAQGTDFFFSKILGRPPPLATPSLAYAMGLNTALILSSTSVRLPSR